MFKSLLGPIVKALVDVPDQHHPVILDFLNKLGGNDAFYVRRRVSNALYENGDSDIEEVTVNTKIHVDRKAQIRYPDRKKIIEHPKLEHTGPTDYDLADIVLWRHDGQQGGKSVSGKVIYQYLIDNKKLESCLGYADALAIQQNGVEAFSELFTTKRLLLWKSAMYYRHGQQYVPAIYDTDEGVDIAWLIIDDLSCYENDPAACFAP